MAILNSAHPIYVGEKSATQFNYILAHRIERRDGDVRLAAMLATKNGSDHLGSACMRGDIRPDKLDLLFLISHLLDLHAGGQSLFTIYYKQMLYTLSKSAALQPLKVGMALLGR